MPAQLGEELAKVADLVVGVADPYVYLAPSDDAERRRTQLAVLRRDLLARPGVAAVVATRPLPPRCPTGDSVDALVCRSLADTPAAGELYVALKPGWFFDPEYVIGKGTSHGSPYLYDRAVPILVRAPGRAAAGRVVTAPQSPATFAATAARLLGVKPPPGARGGASLAR